MDDDQRLSAMRDTRQRLEDAIRDIDFELERAEHAAVNAEEPARLISYIGERYRAQQGHFYDLGKINAQIEEIEVRSRERALSAEERGMAEDWEHAVQSEDHIDWLRPALNEVAASRDVVDAERDYDRAEERLLEDMHREAPDHEDHLEWFRAR